jgi:large subunit ribosomal protein L18e
MLQAPVRIAALNFSQSASEKIRQADGECMTIEDLITNNPKGSRVRILR